MVAFFRGHPAKDRDALAVLGDLRKVLADQEVRRGLDLLDSILAGLDERANALLPAGED